MRRVGRGAGSQAHGARSHALHFRTRGRPSRLSQLFGHGPSPGHTDRRAVQREGCVAWPSRQLSKNPTWGVNSKP